MRIYCYSSLKYYAGILISLLPFNEHLVGNFFFLFFLSILGRFLQILLYTVNESVQTSFFFNSEI
jgi:hypothetical protein